MPEYFPSRAVFFEGRSPVRTNGLNALLRQDMANSQVSPFESTTPQVLRTRRYVSADFGKFHLAQPANNQRLEPVSPGEVGDLYIGGVGLGVNNAGPNPGAAA